MNIRFLKYFLLLFISWLFSGNAIYGQYIVTPKLPAQKILLADPLVIFDKETTDLLQKPIVKHYDYSSYYKRHLGFMCKAELHVEQTTKLPLKIRLGSLAYTNWMEHKLNSTKEK